MKVERVDPLAKARLAAVERAVYSHVQALRALGHDTVNSIEVARALGVSEADVLAALKQLNTRGVRVAR